MLEKTIHELDLQNCVELTWNCDKSGLPHEPQKCKIISAKGQKTMHVFLFSRSILNDQNHWKQPRNSFMSFFQNFACKAYLSGISEISKNFSLRNLSVPASAFSFMWHMFMSINCVQYIGITTLLE